MAKRIMVINDTQEILQLFYDLLTDRGFEVSLFSYGTRELDDVKRAQPDLIISDHPPFQEQEGWQFLQKLKMDPQTARIPVIICTTALKWLRENIDEGWLAVKGVAIVPKPFDIEELYQEIDASLRLSERDAFKRGKPAGQDAPEDESA